MNGNRLLVLAASAALASGAALAQTNVLYGSRDYYPSPERPYGWRGDGTAAWPGATPVTEWREGTPKRGTAMSLPTDAASNAETDEKKAESGSKMHGVWVLQDRKAKNIAWKLKMPSFANSQPIVAGDRVFSSSEPRSLVCADVNSGKILWVRDNSPADFMGQSEEEADALMECVDRLLTMDALFKYLTGVYYRLPASGTPEQCAKWLRHIALGDEFLLTMNRGRFGDRFQEALKQSDIALEKFTALNSEDASASLKYNMMKVEAAAGAWISETYNFYPHSLWHGWIGWTFAAPETDGEFVYFTTGQGTAACYDLSGERVWSRFIPYKEGGMATFRGSCMGGSGAAAPRLVGDTFCFFVTTGPDKCDSLYGLDKRTGKILWSTADERVVMGMARGLGRLAIPRPDGSILHALASTRGGVVRVTDGKVLGFHGLNHNHGPDEQGSSDIASGNRWYVMERSSVVAFDLTASKDDEVTFTKVWQAPVTQLGNCPVLGDGYFYRMAKGKEVINLADGSVRLCKPNEGNGFTLGFYTSPIMAGKYLINYDQGHRRRVPFTSACQVLEPVDGMPKRIVEDNVLDGDPIPGMPDLERYIPGYKPGDMWSWCGATPLHFGYGSMSAMANRLFLRSVSQLYCIGDPDKPYDWNPESRPKHIREKLEAADKALAARDPVDALSSPYGWDRDRGREAIGSMKPAEKQARLERIAALTAGDGWRTLKAAAGTLVDMGAAAKSAIPKLQESLAKWVEAKKPDRSMELLVAIQAIDPDAAGAIVPKLVAALESGDPAAIITAARLGARIGGGAKPLVPGLVKALASADDKVAWESALALRVVGIGEPGVVPALKAALNHKYRWVALAAVDALAVRGASAAETVPELTACLKRDDPRIVPRAAEVLGGLGTASAVAMPELYVTLQSNDIRCVTAAAEALLKMEPDQKKLAKAIIKNLSLKDERKVKNNARALGLIGPKLKDGLLRSDAIDAVAELLVKAPDLKREGARDLAGFGPQARTALAALKDAALGPDCPLLAREALKKIAPDLDLKGLRPAMGGDAEL
jgi:outer membrane protein assembly factor BamB